MRAILAALLLAAATCAQAADTRAYGKPLPPGDTVPLSVAIDRFGTHAGRPMRFSGRIADVCQSEGCWMVLEDDGRTARVKFGDHDFFLPKDSTGRAVVHGVLSRRELTPEQVEHLAAEGRGLAIASVEYRIVADGVEVTP